MANARAAVGQEQSHIKMFGDEKRQGHGDWAAVSPKSSHWDLVRRTPRDVKGRIFGPF
jgi:hypothetical protein